MTNSIDLQVAVLLATLFARVVSMAAGLLLLRGGLKLLLLDSAGTRITYRAWPEAKWIESVVGIGLIALGVVLAGAAAVRLLT